jgi:hypothetical protein
MCGGIGFRASLRYAGNYPSSALEFLNLHYQEQNVENVLKITRKVFSNRLNKAL